jgi:hypothetical protein
MLTINSNPGYCLAGVPWKYLHEPNLTLTREMMASLVVLCNHIAAVMGEFPTADDLASLESSIATLTDIRSAPLPK